MYGELLQVQEVPDPTERAHGNATVLGATTGNFVYAPPLQGF